MRRFVTYFTIALLTAVAGLAIAAVWASSRSQAVSKAEVGHLTNELHGALLRKDITTIDRILADDLTITRTDGSVINKSEWLIILSQSEYKIDSIEVNDLYVEPDGGKAVVTGLFKMLAHFEERRPIEHSSKFTYTYEKRQEKWQLVYLRSQKE